MACLLEETINHNFGDGDPIVLNLVEESWYGNWIENVWKYLFEHFSEFLSKFATLPLLPLLMTGRWDDDSWTHGEVHLHRMDKLFLLKSDTDIEELSNDVCNAFEHLSVVVLPSLPGWIDARQLDNVFCPTGPRLVFLMERIFSERPQSVDVFNARCQRPEADAFISLLERIMPSLKGNSILAFLQRLKIFTLKSSSEDSPMLSSISSHSQMTDANLSLPVRFSKPLLVSSSPSCMAVAQKLGVTKIKEEQLVVDTLRAMNCSTYNTQECDKFMTWLLARINKYQGNRDIVSLAKQISFVPNGVEKHKPSDLYDPRDILLISLFSGENKFPSEGFCSNQNLDALKLLGLRTVENVTPNCLYTVAKRLDLMCKTGSVRNDVEEKAKSLLKIFERRPDILKSQLDSTRQPLYASVRDLQCLPHQKERPADYPKDLVWKGSEFVLCSPAELKSMTFSTIAGSVIPLIKIDLKVAQMFNMSSNPEAKVIAKQLENLIKAYSSSNKPYLAPLISNVYKRMANRPDVISSAEFQKLLEGKCIWWGDGFCRPSEIIMEKRKGDIDLIPYMYPLPVELQSLKILFEKVRCNRQQDVSVLLKVLEMVSEKQRTNQSGDVNEFRKDFNLVLQILNKLFQDKVKPQHCGDRLLFPVHTGDDTRLLLKPYTQCTYCDAQWLKELTDDDDDEEILYVHGDVPLKIAEELGVKSLKRQLMSDAEGLEEWGQEEPLTRRLHNLLKDGYVDGLAVPKEIIQNADDAGATTVQFIYDERENLDARTQLLDEGMAECQGPALWAYNNSQFSESDLKNITKLSGATKETDTTKIGKFGLGFCAVYNLTDVPSFLSGQNMVIFDPHTKYLNKALPGNSPGLRINLRTLKNQRMMKRMNNQFKPFQGVFDCNLLTSDPSFNGTLFRLPLRTAIQAGSSDIKKVSYSKEEMVGLLKQLVEASGNMLLFTQNLREIKVLHIPSTGVEPSEAILMCKVTKDMKQQTIASNVLDTCSKLKTNRSLCSEPFSSLQTIEVTVECQNQRGILGSAPSGKTYSQWLVSWATGKPNSKSLELSYSTNIKGALPLGSVAISIQSDAEKCEPRSLSECPFGFYKAGHVFCYLPLPVQSNLEFHVNGSFAVTSDRRSLQTSTEDDKYCSYDSKWNDALLSDAVSQALVNVLVNLQSPDKLDMPSLAQEYLFHQFWPTNASSLSRLTTGFYANVVETKSPVFQTFGSRQWLGIDNCLFLDKALTQNTDIKDIALSTLERFGCTTYAKTGVVDIPRSYVVELQKTNNWNIHMMIVGEEEFFLKVFLPNVGDAYWQANAEARRKLMLHCLRHSTASIREKIKVTACIPTRPSGSLRKPQDLIYPGTLVSRLFSETDERFPDENFDDQTILQTLVGLGMMKDTLQLDLVQDRALSIVALSSVDKSGALERCKHFIDYLLTISHCQENTIRGLSDIDFLPVLGKPDNWPFHWKGDTTREPDMCGTVKDFDSPKRLYLRSCKKLVACEERILDDNRIGGSAIRTHLFQLLGVRSSSAVEPDTVLSQLISVCNHTRTDLNDLSKRATDEVLDEIYQFMNKTVAEKPHVFKTKLLQLREQPVIRLGPEFLPPSKVAFSLEYDCSPELYGINTDRICQYSSFLTALGVKENFEVKDLIDIIRTKKNTFHDTALPQKEFQLIFRLLLCLSNLMLKTGLVYEDIAEQYGKDNILAPDICQILRPTHTLCFDDCDDIDATTSMTFIHSDMSPAHAERLGVLTKRIKHIEDCSIEIPFEQKEELVTRLKRLLDGYPCDAAILKELIQNADDAKATELHFLKDFRTHSCSQIFDSVFKEFQGPALLVYNDSSFTQADLKGIQQLGIGSKSDDPAKTGQYGVGFNAVYNLTDLPSFLTKGPEIEGGETLCILDPLHKHSKKRIGTRYVDMRAIRKSYPDVFAGYSEDIFFTAERQTGTVFRFPLRQTESDISSNVITPETLKGVFALFKYDIQEMMLFLKHVTKISVSSITDENLTLEQSVELSLNDEDQSEREKFSKHYANSAKDVKMKKISVLEIEPLQVSYTIRANEYRGVDHIWYVGQTVGLPRNEEVPEAVKSAVVDGKLGLMPVGGVAMKLPNVSERPRVSAEWERKTNLYAQRNGRPYCFLPLPGHTGLPLHVNGHFILDHETRRGIWKRENEDDFKSVWNSLILTKLIPMAFVKALNFLRTMVLFQDSTASYTEAHLLEKLLTFDGFFPTVKDSVDDNWKAVAKHVLRIIVENDEKMFPIPLKLPTDDAKIRYGLSWNSVYQTGHMFPTYAAQIDICLSLMDTRHNLLRTMGMKVASVSRDLRTSFEDADKPLPLVTDTAVLKFVKSYSSTAIDKCRIDQIPVKVEHSIFENVPNVNEILFRCTHSESFAEEVDGLPLLVTNDGMLRCFSSTNSVFCSTFAGLLRASGEKFVHVGQIITISVDSVTSVVKSFHIDDFAHILPDEIPSERYDRNVFVDWNPNAPEIPNRTWINTLWEFLELDFEGSKKEGEDNKLETFLKPLEQWCLIPAVKNEETCVLVRVRNAFSVIDIETFKSVAAVYEVLKKLELPCLETSCFSEHAHLLMATQLTRAENPLSVLICLKYYKDSIKQKKLDPSDCLAILGYLSDNLKTMRESENIDNTWLIETLRSLPLYVTKNGQCLSFEDQNCRVLVIPKGVPEDGLEEWANLTRTVLLRNESKVGSLYRFLGFTKTECIDVYTEYILQHWDSLPDFDVFVHLKYVKDKLLHVSCNGKHDEKQIRLIQIMQCIPLIPENGIRRRVSDYYNPLHPVFKVMCRKQEFPPEFLCECEKEGWIGFLKLIGMKTTVTGEMFLRFAREVASEGRLGITEDIAVRSEVLVKHLFSHNDAWDQWTYQEVSRVCFVIPHVVDMQYTQAHKQYNDTNYFICFKNAISSFYEQLVWTSLPLLSKRADPKEYYKQGDKRHMLGIYKDPPLASVIHHTQNICDSLKKHFETNIPEQERHESFCWVSPLMETLYETLQYKGLQSRDMTEKLRHTPVVFIPDYSLFIQANSVVQDLNSEQEISPYILKAPFRYGKFFELFEKLGAARYPSYKHYIRVLATIKEETKGKPLTEEYLTEWGAIRVALENLFYLRQTTFADGYTGYERGERDEEAVPELFLPSRDKLMVKSTELTVADNRYYKERVGSSANLTYVMDFKAVKLGYTVQSLKWLPRSIRPKFLSAIVKENVDTSHMQEEETSLAGRRLEEFLHSEHFICAVLRLLKHFKSEEQLSLNKKEEDAISAKIQNTRVRQVSGLKTQLYLNGTVLDNSAKSKDCFVQLPDKKGKNEQLSIYFQNEFESEQEFVQSIAEHLIKYIKHILSFNVPELLIIQVFNKINDPNGISLMLDEVPIDPYDAPTEILESVFPKPGTYVPVKYHHLLNCDFSDFRPHEYFSVALEIEDTGILDDAEESDPIYIYVRIEGKVQSNGASIVTQEYEVFTGSETVVVEAFKIYKFVRQRRGAGTDLVDAGDIPKPSSNLSKTKIFYSIRRILEEAWTLSKEKRRRILKRLYLKWHPDKNIGNEEFCGEVFKYIQEIVYKLDHGIPLDEDDTDGATSRRRRAPDDYASPEYFNFFERMNRRGRRDREYAEAFSTPGPPRHSSAGDRVFHGQSEKEPFKDFVEARRWHRQAKVDLRNAKETIDTPGDPPAYNWICYMCHQVYMSHVMRKQSRWFPKRSGTIRTVQAQKMATD